MKIQGRIITPEEGKMLRRISDGWECWGSLHLGYTHYIGGVKLDTPLEELPEHYEEVDLPPMSEEERFMYERTKREEEIQKLHNTELNYEEN